MMGAMSPDWAGASGRIPQGAAVYAAEEEWTYLMVDYGPDDALSALEPGDVSGFIANAIELAGWECPAPPVILFDVPDDGELAGLHGGGSDGAIHLHPRLASPAHVLHELAHWLLSGDWTVAQQGEGGHGPRYRATMVELVEAALGTEPAGLLREAYSNADLPIEAHR